MLLPVLLLSLTVSVSVVLAKQNVVAKNGCGISSLQYAELQTSGETLLLSSSCSGQVCSKSVYRAGDNWETSYYKVSSSLPKHLSLITSCKHSSYAAILNTDTGLAEMAYWFGVMSRTS
ncbi:unnamed protein product [Heterosigma akashiwo]|mmetsp:Transcript_17195/g.26425  ORF Transcript_17195/g.26425 Transcript_17195/m.26425 type:complete len:119 (+) Transcript_17195:62-418(+)